MPRALGVAGLFDVSVIANGQLRGTSPSGATLTGRVGAGGTLPTRGTVVATASAGGRQVKLTATGRHLTAGAYRWIVLSNRTVYGASRRGPGFGGIGGVNVLRPHGKGVVRIIKAGSAGQPGFDDARCRALANEVNRTGHDLNKALDKVGQSPTNANAQAVNKADTAHTKALNTLTDHCMVFGTGLV